MHQAVKPNIKDVLETQCDIRRTSERRDEGGSFRRRQLFAADEKFDGALDFSLGY